MYFRTDASYVGQTKVIRVDIHDYAAYYRALADGSRGYGDQLHWCLVDFERVTGITELADLSVDAINRYLSATKERLAPKTRANRRGYLRMLLNHAATNPAIKDGPSIPDEPLAKVRVPDAIVRAWSPDEVARLLAAVNRLRGRYVNGFSKRLYWRSYILSAWDLGLRGCDMRSIERDWIPDHGRLTIVQAKTGRVVSCQLRPPAMEAIAEFKHGGRLIWPLWCRIDSWRKVARKLVTNAGLSGSIGRLRASAATALEITQPGTGHLFLGHSNRQTFERHYFDRSQQLSRPQPPLLVSR